MITKRIYEQRFDNRKERNKLWKILVNNFFQKFIDKNDIVLDFGCGYGEFINNIKSKKRYACDIDRSFKTFLDKNVIFIQNNIQKINLPANSVNKIFISNVFEHIGRQDIPRLIEELYRILKANGEVLILQPNIRFCAKDYWMFFDHITPIDDRALMEIFSVYNFKLKKKILRFLPYTTKSKIPKFSFLIKLYLNLPLAWRFLGKQSFLIFKK